MDVYLSPWEIIIRLVVSAMVGFIIGLNRERHSSAGVRTHMILAVGVCVITLVQIHLTAEAINWYKDNPRFIGVVGNDTARLTAQIVSGIGFLGSGLILVRNDKTVDGMTSAVSLWTVASISIAIGYGHYLISFLGAAFLIIILTVLNFRTTRFSIVNLDVRFKDFELDRAMVNEFLQDYHGKVTNYTMENLSADGNNEYRYIYEIEYMGFMDKIEFIDSFIAKFENITYIELS